VQIRPGRRNSKAGAQAHTGGRGGPRRPQPRARPSLPGAALLVPPRPRPGARPVRLPGRGREGGCLGPAPVRTPAAGLQGWARAPRPGQEDGGERAGAEAGAALQAGDRHRAGHPAAAGPGGVELQRPGRRRAGRGAPTAGRAGRPGAGARGVLARLRVAPAQPDKWDTGRVRAGCRWTPGAGRSLPGAPFSGLPGGLCAGAVRDPEARTAGGLGAEVGERVMVRWSSAAER
jgi:hypothetical protein